MKLPLIHEVKQGAGHKHYELIRSVLASCKIAWEDQNNVLKTVLESLNATEGQCVRDAVRSPGSNLVCGKSRADLNGNGSD